MSSGYSYFDTEAARIAARGQCEQVAERLVSSVAAVRVREGQAAVPGTLLDDRPSSDAGRATFLAWSAAATVQAAEFEARVAAHDQKRNAEGIAAQFRALAMSGPIAAPRRTTGQTDQGVGAHSGRQDELLMSTAHDTPTAQEIMEQIAVVLDGVDPGASAQEREALTVLAHQVVDAPEQSRRTLLTDLRVRVQQVDRAVSERREQLARAQFLVATLEGLDEPAVADERVFLGAVMRGGAVLTPADVERIERVREQAVAEQERRFVADRLARVLSSLGYRVDDGFLADLRAGRAGFALLDDSEEHAVRVEIEEGALDYGLVRTRDGDDVDRDRALEGELCGHMGRFMASVQPDGVAFRFREHRAPGSRPLEVSRAAAEVASRQKGATKPRLRERER